MREIYRAIEEGSSQRPRSTGTKAAQHGRPLRAGHIHHGFRRRGRPVSAFGIGLDITAQVRRAGEIPPCHTDAAVLAPDAIGTFRLNLTRRPGGPDSPCQTRSSKKTVMSETADGFFRNVADTIADEDERRDILNGAAVKSCWPIMWRGVSNFSLEYRRRADEYRCQWIRAYFSLLRNPDTGDVGVRHHGSGYDHTAPGRRHIRARYKPGIRLCGAAAHGRAPSVFETQHQTLKALPSDAWGSPEFSSTLIKSGNSLLPAGWTWRTGRAI